jgi:hypothetical protein
VVELLLEIDRVRGDHHPATVGDGVGRRRPEVGQALPGPGARLDDQVQPVGQGLGDGAGHLQLTGTGFEPGEGAGERSVRGEGGVDRPLLHHLAHPRWLQRRGRRLAEEGQVVLLV